MITTMRVKKISPENTNQDQRENRLTDLPPDHDELPNRLCLLSMDPDDEFDDDAFLYGDDPT